MSDESLLKSFLKPIIGHFSTLTLGFLGGFGVKELIEIFTQIPWWVYAISGVALVAILFVMLYFSMATIRRYWDSMLSPGLWDAYKKQLRAWESIRRHNADRNSRDAKKILGEYQSTLARLNRVITLNKDLILKHHQSAHAPRRAEIMFGNLQQTLSYPDPDDFFKKCQRNTAGELDCFDDNFILIAERNSLISLKNRG